ncbi:MAG: Gfo/Idh/MocA family oxidoreductase [Rhodospirillales bacterium]|nr:Gfo/Idh/MocA family oxidoreductase [Alphaproteobacteria bacterium]MBL6929633.1 Gfo/Idh/MocA family oxidoreductase [Rhodospirillales bacterium]
MTKHRMGIVGLGMAVTPHAKSLMDLADRVEVAGAYNRGEERRKAFAEKFPQFPVTDDLDSLLADSSIDCMLVLTTPDNHLETVTKCAQAGKHVLLEKPLEITTKRSVEMIQACRDAGVTLGIVLQHRRRPGGIRLREILKSGKLGRVAGASVFVPNWRPQIGYYDQPGRGDKLRDGGGVLITQGIHTIDVFLSLTAQPVEVTAYAQTSPVHQMETEDIVAASVRYEDGSIGVVDATTTAYPGFPERIQFYCEKGSAVITGTELKVAYHDGEREVIEADPAVGGTGADPMDFPHDHHREIMADFLDALDEGRDPLISGEEALKTHRFADAILQSAEQGRPVAVVKG